MMWIAFTLIALCAAAFVLAGLLRRGAMEHGATELSLNRALYEEKIAELAQQEASGELGADQRRALEREYQRQFLVDSSDVSAERARDRGRWVFPVLAVAVPLFAVIVYLRIGAADELALRALFEERFSGVTVETPAATVQAMDAEILKRLEQLSQSRADRPVYPVLLARLSVERGDLDTAVGYYRRAVDLLPSDGALQAEYAQALFLTMGNRMTDEVRSVVQSAYTLAPDDQTALGLMGIAAFQEDRYRDAIRYWQRALDQLPPNSASRAALVAGIDSAEARLVTADIQGSTGAETDNGASGDSAALPAGSTLVVDVSLAEALEVPPETTGFVYARAWQGSPMPLAIKRLTRADLPARIVLDNSLAMSPAMNLDSVDELEVVARVSFAGTATAAPGDIEGSQGPVSTGDDEPLALVIDRELP